MGFASRVNLLPEKIDPPLAGLELLPLTSDEGSLEMRRAQERYVFVRVKR